MTTLYSDHAALAKGFAQSPKEATDITEGHGGKPGRLNFTEKDRYGLDDRSRIILTVKDGKYVPAK